MTFKGVINAHQTIITHELNEKYPTCRKGERIEIHRKNGNVCEGTFAGSENDGILLCTDKGQLSIPFIELDPGSRVRLDKAGRKILTENLARERTLDFFMGPNETKDETHNIRHTYSTLSLGKQPGGSRSRKLSQ